MGFQFDHWGHFQRIWGTRLKWYSISVTGHHFRGHKIKWDISITGGTFSAYSISITGAPFQRGGHKIKGEISITGALFQRTLCNVLNVKMKRGQIFGYSKKWGYFWFHCPCTGLPCRYPHKNLTAKKRFLGDRCQYLRTFYSRAPPPSKSLIHRHKMPCCCFWSPTESQAPPTFLFIY